VRFLSSCIVELTGPMSRDVSIEVYLTHTIQVSAIRGHGHYLAQRLPMVR